MSYVDDVPGLLVAQKLDVGPTEEDGTKGDRQRGFRKSFLISRRIIFTAAFIRVYGRVSTRFEGVVIGRVIIRWQLS